MMSRTRDWWEHRRLRTQTHESGGPLVCALLELDGAPAGYALYRVPGTTCTDGQLFADALTSDSIFTYTAQNIPAGSYALARLHVDFTVNVEPAKAYTRYRLVDDIAFRNSPRS